MILISWDHKKLISWERENTVSEPYQYKEGIISRIITEEFERRLEFKRRMKMNLEILTVEESDKRKLMSVIPAHGEKFLFMAKMKLEDLKISYPKAEFYLVYDGKYYSVRGNDIFQEYMNVEYEKEKLKNIPSLGSKIRKKYNDEMDKLNEAEREAQKALNEAQKKIDEA